jgi:phage I-like protein
METDKSGNVLRILRAALTNTPNLSELATLHGATAGLTEQDRAICRHMGIDPAQLAAHRGATAHATKPYDGALSQEQMRIWRTMGMDEAKYREQEAREAAKSEAIGTLSKEELKLCRAMGMDPVKYAEQKRKQIHAAQADNGTLSEDELEACRAMGIDPAKYAALKREQATKGEQEQLPGLSKAEIDMCNKLGIDLKKFSDFRMYMKKKNEALRGAGKLGFVPESAYLKGGPR